MDLLKQGSATREDMGLLAVMDALATEEQVTQRELSRLTGLNLKKVNYCLHKLLEKGYVKFQNVVKNPDKRTYLYILTPAGVKAKSHLTYRFLQFTLGFYNQVESKVQQCLSKMSKSGIRKIVLYGASDAAKIVIQMIDNKDLEVIGVLDQHFKGLHYGDLPVLQYEDLRIIEWDAIMITALEELDEVEAVLRDWGLPEESIWRL